MSNSIAPGSSADVNVRVAALTTNPNVPVTYKTIILKKNLVNGVNTLTQAMMNQTNTKYVIKYDYTLGEDITVPAGCILEFDGGSITASGNNDTITGQNTGIIGDFNFNSTTIAGTWNNSTIIATQLKGGSDNKTFNTTYLQNLIGVFGEVEIPEGEWYIGTISIDSTSKCNVFKGVSRKGTILHADSIYVGKSAVDEVPIGLSPRVESFTLISNTTGSGIGLEVWGYNMILRDLYIKGFEYGIRKSRNNGELITSQIEKVIIFKCVYGIYLVTSSEQTANIYSINANIIKDCFIVDCLTCGIKVMGTSNIIRDSALQGSPTNIIITGMSDTGTPVFDYNIAVINCYFEAKAEGSTVTGVDIDIQNVNSTYIYGLAIKNNYHSAVVNGQSRYYDIVKFALSTIHYPELLNNCDIDRYRKEGVYYPMSLILGVNAEDRITTIDGNKYIACDGEFGRVNLEIGRTYRVYMIARKTDGSLGANVVMLIRNVATTSQMHYINYAVDALNQDKVGYVDITPTTSTLYEIFQNASQPYLVRELIIKDITLDAQ